MILYWFGIEMSLLFSTSSGSEFAFNWCGRLAGSGQFDVVFFWREHLTDKNMCRPLTQILGLTKIYLSQKYGWSTGTVYYLFIFTFHDLLINLMFKFKMTLEEEMICGWFQTLNELVTQYSLAKSMNC